MKSYGFTNCNDTFSASFSYDPILCTMNFYLTPSVHGRNLLVCMTIIKMKPLRICFVPLVFPYFAGRNLRCFFFKLLFVTLMGKLVCRKV